ncbi:MAG: tRNA (cytidine(34)-2'-O)-methyltransferase [Alphaproteobacteria bacterium]|nr:tRNA (cytidine(34)-2'-O)-methyltransferase [Alphaproteobacteria bacterium]
MSSILPSNENTDRIIVRLALFQPDMPSNAGTMMRLCACLGVGMDIVEPCGFPLDDARLRRAAMDYIDHLDFVRYASWESFEPQIKPRRLVLLTTKAAVDYAEFSFLSNDVVMVGRESAGVPDFVHKRADARLVIPIKSPMRSLNVAISAAIALSEARRQMLDGGEE